ncbi:hypothetical protein ACFE04_020518 [Oxalis oulophora]
MGEQVVVAKAEGEKKPDEVKKDGGDGNVTAVYKIDFHCEGCAKKVRRAIKNYEGIESVKTDGSANKLTVVGKFDPVKVKERLEDKIKRKVVIVSPLPKKPDDDNKKPADDVKIQVENKKDVDDANKKPQPPKPESTIVLKIRLHCDGCIHKIKKIISKFKGVNSVSVDASKDLVTVKGTMDPKALVPYLKQKLRRSVEVIPAKKDDDNKDAGGGDKKEKATEGGGDKKKAGGEDAKPAGGDGEKKKDGGGGGDAKAAGGDGEKKKEGGGGDDAKATGGDGGGGAKAEVNKFDHYGYSSYNSEPSYWFDEGHMYGHNHSVVPYDGHVYGHNHSVVPNDGHVYNQNHSMVPFAGQYNNHYEYNPQERYGNVHQGYMNHNTYGAVDHHAPQMFSDENPHGCSVM